MINIIKNYLKIKRYEINKRKVSRHLILTTPPSHCIKCHKFIMIHNSGQGLLQCCDTCYETISRYSDIFSWDQEEDR